MLSKYDLVLYPNMNNREFTPNFDIRPGSYADLGPNFCVLIIEC